MIIGLDGARKASLRDLIKHYAAAVADVRDTNRLVDSEAMRVIRERRFEMLEAELTRRLDAIGDYIDRGYLVSVEVDRAWKGAP